MNRFHPKKPDYLVELAREARRNKTVTESLLWEELRKRRLDGLRFRDQHILGRYRADFYCFEAKLVVEIDGPIHDSTKEYDALRDAWMHAQDIETLRIKADAVRNDMASVLKKIRHAAFRRRQHLTRKNGPKVPQRGI